MRAVDTNVLVRLIARDDPHQAAIAQAFIEKGVWVSTLALAECIWVLGNVYGFSAQQLMDSVELFLNHNDVTLQDADAVAAALVLFRAKPSLGFSDCLLLELARKAGHLPVGTFDRTLGKASGAQKL
jgi:predicted nucleic-acid-binding protein